MLHGPDLELQTGMQSTSLYRSKEVSEQGGKSKRFIDGLISIASRARLILAHIGWLASNRNRAESITHRGCVSMVLRDGSRSLTAVHTVTSFKVRGFETISDKCTFIVCHAPQLLSLGHGFIISKRQ